MEFKTQTVKNEVVYHVDEWTKYFWKYLPFSYVLEEISPEEKKKKHTQLFLAIPPFDKCTPAILYSSEKKKAKPIYLLIDMRP